MTKELHTVSSVREYRKCKRRYRYKYKDRVRPVRKGKALHVGSAFHRGLEAFSGGDPLGVALSMLIGDEDSGYWVGEEGRIEYYRTRAMLRAYYARWEDTRANWETIEIEGEFETSLVATSRFGGKRDSIWRRISANLYLVEHKTTSDDISNVGTDYWQRLAIDVQLDAYLYDLTDHYGVMPSILYDVTRKPGGKPKLKKAVAKCKSETPDEFIARREALRESLDEFEERLFQQMIKEPNKYLVRREIHRMMGQHNETIGELRETLTEIDNYTGCYPRTDTACAIFSACPYLGVCTGAENLDSERFVKLRAANPELTFNESEDDDDDDCPI